MVSNTRRNCGLSPYWPGVKTSDNALQRPSADRWILVVNPPRERPRHSPV